MAYREQNAIVRISTLTSSPTALTGAQRLDTTLLSYDNNITLVGEKNRLSFTQMMTTRRASGYDGYFSHIICDRQVNGAGKNNSTLLANYRSGGERPIGAGNGVEFGEMSCALPTIDPLDYEVGIQTLISAQYNDNAVDNTSLVEFL